MQEIAVAGVAPDGSPARLTRIGGFHVDVAPRDTLVILTNHDVPGVIGRVGTLLGDAGVNIASFSSNTGYWKVRYEDGGRTLVCYKTVQGTGATGNGTATPNDWGPDGVQGKEVFIGVAV